jgi:cyclopropane fatty-acyl-phospholipid synthase-like methyltransferase
VTDLFDASAMYDDDYLYFFAGAGTASDAGAELTWRLLDLRPDMTVLDLARGHGDLSNAPAARGCRVTGVDSSVVFLDRARADAAAARPTGPSSTASPAPCDPAAGWRWTSTT